MGHEEDCLDQNCGLCNGTVFTTQEGRQTSYFPSIDHGLLSPSGRISKRARAAALQREATRLFAGVILQPPIPQPTQQEQYRQQAKRLRDLSDRGMKRRAYAKEANRLETLAAELDRVSTQPQEARSR